MCILKPHVENVRAAKSPGDNQSPLCPRMKRKKNVFRCIVVERRKLQLLPLLTLSTFSSFFFSFFFFFQAKCNLVKQREERRDSIIGEHRHKGVSICVFLSVDRLNREFNATLLICVIPRSQSIWSALLAVCRASIRLGRYSNKM